MTSYTIYVDLDGVVFDFEKKALEITGLVMRAANQDRELKREFWKRLNAHISAGGKFFEELDLLPDALDLWNYVTPHGAVFCTATGNVTNAREEKTAAIRRHFGNDAADKAILVRHSADKALHASPSSILIDDRTKSIDPWVEAGGIGILHTSTADTLIKLKELGI